jgi:hypothetical protein
MTKSLTKVISAIAVVLLITVTSVMLYAFSGGITGVTKKGSSPGCTCHGPSPTATTQVSFIGPDTVIAGQTVQYTIVVSNSTQSAAGVDIAVERGTLAAANSSLRLQSGELTHNSPIGFTSGSASILFNYTAPSTTGLDTIYANGNAVNLSGNNSGDFWNFATNKKIVVKNASSVKEISNKIPEGFELKQNFPNPFNPSTKIRFALPENSDVVLTVMDITGRVVAELHNGALKAGSYEYDFNATNFASGIYFYKLSTKNFSEVKKMSLIK